MRQQRTDRTWMLGLASLSLSSSRCSSSITHLARFLSHSLISVSRTVGSASGRSLRDGNRRRETDMEGKSEE